MNPAEEPLDDALVAALAEFEDAHLAGRDDSTHRERVPDGLKTPLSKAEECVRLLAQLRPRSDGPHIGRFAVERELGRGSFGIVYLARDPVLGRRVALKVPRIEVVLSDDLLTRFRREAQTAAALDHPCIVPVHEAGVAGQHCYIASTYCEGTNLAEWLKTHGHTVEPRTAAKLVHDLAEAVEHAHGRGVIHRDLKPSNILLEGEGLARPRIADFGMARFLAEASELTASRAAIGTPSYMAPEQARGDRGAIGPGCDVYSLGAILYETLTGRPPFQAETVLETLDKVRSEEPVLPSKVRPGISADLETICLKCLRKDPTQRYPSARELADDLKRFLDGQAVRARRAGFREHFLNWCSRPSRVRDGAVATIAFAGVMLLYSLSSLIFMLNNPDMIADVATYATLASFWTIYYVTLVVLAVGVLRTRSGKLVAWSIALELAYPVFLYLGEFVLIDTLSKRPTEEERFVYTWARYFFSAMTISAALANVAAMYSLRRRRRTTTAG